jgi:hypothetical protein
MSKVLRPIAYEVHCPTFTIHTNGVTLEKDAVRACGLHVTIDGNESRCEAWKYVKWKEICEDTFF